MLKGITDRHREIIRRLVKGEDQTSIARSLGISPQRIGQLKRDPIFASALAEVRDVVEAKYVSERVTAMEVLEEAATEAAEFNVGMMRNEDVPLALRLKSCWDILDRTGNKAVEKHLSVHADITELITEAYNRRRQQQSCHADEGHGS